MGREETTYSRRLRQALWDVYGGCCAYTGAPIARAEEVQIDHVLPRWLGKDESERKRLLEKFALPPGFQIERNLLNLVPTTAAFNNAKGAKTEKIELIANVSRQYLHYRSYQDRENAWEKPADELIRHGLALAAMNRAEVERRESELEISDLLGTAIDRSPKEQHRNLPDLMDKLTGGAEPFPRRFERWTNSATAQGGAAHLNFYFPTESAPSGSAVLLFRSLRIRDAMISFGCRELLTGLFRGFRGVPEGERPFVRPANKGYFIQVQNARFWASKSEAQDLCAVVDVAATEYLHASEAVERKWRSLNLVQAKNGYRLCEVGLPVWIALARYATGDTKLSEQHALHRAVPVRDGPDGQTGSIAAWLRAEQAGWASRVFVCWDPKEGAQLAQESGSEAWHAEKVQDWLDERALPSLLRPPRRVSWLENLLRRHSTQTSPVEDRKFREITNAYEWKRNTGTAFETSPAMLRALQEMINHFVPGRPHAGLPVEHLRSIYDFISDFAKRNRVPGGYSASAARALPTRTSCEDLDVALQEVRSSAESIEFASTFIVQPALAALFELLGGWHGFDVNDKERDEAAHALDEVYQYARWRAYLERLIEREW